MDRFEIIRNKAQRDKGIKQKVLEDTKTKEKALLEQSKALYPRVKYLLDLANECITNDVEIGQIMSKNWRTNYHEESNYFLTDGWAHHLGFYLQGGDAVAIGKEGGGACHYHVAITEDETIVDGEDGFETLKYILDKFDSFEKRFLDYIDSLA